MNGPSAEARAAADPAAAQASRVLSVVHETVYRYERPVELSMHHLRLRPVHDAGQDLLEHALDVTPAGIRGEYEDVFGNQVTRLEIEEGFSEMRVVARSLVRRRPLASLSSGAPIGRLTIPLVWMPWQREMMHPYLLPAELPETQLRELTEFAMSFVERQDYDLVATLLDMNKTIHRDFAYVPGSTRLETTPFEVLTHRRGVCQDFANLLICLARLLNIPARYRVGYIFTGGDYANKLQSEASHAWAELYLPWTGWCGLDPTNGCLAGRDHIRVACGRNYREASPTTGTIYRGGGRETLEISVRVEERP
jgi:transglutaminase-like putative cysteine protease